MNCEDLLKMKQFRQGMKLVAGEMGLGRNIRWIYFADCVQCLADDIDIAELIYGEELVIVTNASLTDDDAKIIDMIQVMQGKNIAGFVINEGQISSHIKSYCDEIELPLFELSVNLHLIDLSQIVCKALVEEESNANSRERILSTILYSDVLDIEEIMDQANYLGVNLTGKYRAIVIQTHEPETLQNEHHHVDEGLQLEMRHNIKKIIKNEFRSFGLGNMLILSQVGVATLLIPADLYSRDLLIAILNNIVRKIESEYHLIVKAGVGTSYEYIADFKKSFQEAKNTLNISKIATKGEKIFFYENLGIYSLITQITNGKFLDDYVGSKIGELIKADKMQEGGLCETLETYLEHNCNANATAESLYIHRNTMRYRMDKIKRILDDELSDMSVFLELKLAFAIKRYRENREE